MTDFLMFQQLHRMIKEIPKPRLMFKKGTLAKGFFRPYMSFAEYTEAKIFESIDEITPVKVRFSSFLGNKGTADTVRNIKSMDIKFDSDGQYDMMCQNIPVFFINDGMKFFPMLKAFTKREPFDCINNCEFWKFIVENPESVNCVIRMFSYEGLSETFINMKWFSVNTCIWSNNSGKKYAVRYQWIPIYDNKGTLRNNKRWLDRISAEFIAGFDNDIAFEELENAVAFGNFPEFELYIQMVDYNDFMEKGYMQRTLLWDRELAPPILAGVIKLTEIPDDRNAKQDRIGFAMTNTVKGIDIYRDEFVEIMDYIYRIEALERGEYD